MGGNLSPTSVWLVWTNSLQLFCTVSPGRMDGWRSVFQNQSDWSHACRSLKGQLSARETHENMTEMDFCVYWRKCGGKNTCWVLHLSLETVGDTVTVGDKVREYSLPCSPLYLQGSCLEWARGRQTDLAAAGCPPVCFESVTFYTFTHRPRGYSYYFTSLLC